MTETNCKGQRYLIADIGATTSRCAIFSMPGQQRGPVRVYRNDDFASPAALFAEFLQHSAGSVQASAPLSCVLAVAAPMVGEDFRMFNRDWRFNTAALKLEFNFAALEVLNDFHAIAYALPKFNSDNRIEIGSATNERDGNIAVLGPGSGLGSAAWIGSAKNGVAMCGEGGHVSMPARNENEAAIIRKLRERYGHCSTERILSGPGLIALHSAMHGIDATTSEEISSDSSDAKSVATLRQFFAFLGSVAADLALITGATGGVYISGGIVPACVDQLIASEFRSRFEDKNRYRDYMRAIPTYVITDPFPGLTGLSAYIAAC